MKYLEKFLYGNRTWNLVFAALVYFGGPAAGFYFQTDMNPSDQSLLMIVLGVSGILFMVGLKTVQADEGGALMRTNEDVMDLPSSGTYHIWLRWIIWKIATWDRKPRSLPCGEVWVLSKKETIDDEEFVRTFIGFNLTLDWAPSGRNFLRTDEEQMKVILRSKAHGRLRPLMRAKNWNNIQDVKEIIERQILGWQYDEHGNMIDEDGIIVFNQADQHREVNDLTQLEGDYGITIKTGDLSEPLYTKEFQASLSKVTDEHFEHVAEDIEDEHIRKLIRTRAERYIEKNYSETDAEEKATLDVLIQLGKIQGSHITGIPDSVGALAGMIGRRP